MEEAIKTIEKEIKRLSKGLNKCNSRWINGYVDGLEKALEIIKGGKNHEKLP